MAAAASGDRAASDFVCGGSLQPRARGSGDPCVALAETVAEKFVALTRRAGAELADAGRPRDPTLVRHIYDLTSSECITIPANTPKEYVHVAIYEVWVL